MSNVRDVTEGKLVRQLVDVFSQLDEIAGQPGKMFGYPKWKPTPRSLEFRYPTGTVRSAEASMRRAVADLERGVVSQEEFDLIEARCERTLRDDGRRT